jgi:transcriptional regulator of acetoin/glycerol metabolism
MNWLQQQKVDYEAAKNETDIKQITAALARNGGDVTAAGKEIGMSRATIFRKAKKLGIDVKAFRPAKPAVSRTS